MKRKERFYEINIFLNKIPKTQLKKWEKLDLKMEKLNFPGTDWRRLALIGAPQKNPAWHMVNIINVACNYFN